MKKLTAIFFFFTIIFLVSLARPSSASAVDTVCLYCPEVCGNSSGTATNSEYFYCELDPGSTRESGSFRVCKDRNCGHWEDFAYDSGNLYHVREFPWTACDGTDIITYNERHAYNDPTSGPMTWLPRNLEPGAEPACVEQHGWVMGFNPETGEVCPTVHSGELGSTVCLAYFDCITFSTGVTIENAYILTATGGAGVGENWYFDDERGWIGFDRNGETDASYPTDPIDNPAAEGCFEATATVPILFPIDDEDFCDPREGGDRDSRPFGEDDDPACDTCNLTRYLTSSCAKGTTAFDTAWYQRKHNDEGDDWCNEYPLIERPWGGTVSVDPSDTIIPFVGREEHESGENYLADYLDGTNEYYEGQNWPLYWLDGVNRDGVWRKLTPMAYQDEMKKGMVRRAQASLAGTIQEGKIHDYDVRYIERLCWNAPFWAEVLTSVVAPNLGLGSLELWKLADRCLYLTNPFYEGWAYFVQLSLNNYGFSTRRMSGQTAQLSALASHLPPSPFEENYRELWDEWYREDLGFFGALLGDKGRWAKLWEVVPMFSRENTPGYISPYLGQQDKDLFYTVNPDAFIEKVPHVARLYEVGGALQNMLMPRYVRTAPPPPPVAQGPKDTSDGVLSLSKDSSKVGLANWTKDTPVPLFTNGGIPNMERKEKTEVGGIQTQVALAASDPQETQTTSLAQSSEPKGQVLGAGTVEGTCARMSVNTSYEEKDGNSVQVFVTIVMEKIYDQPRGMHFELKTNGNLAMLGMEQLMNPTYTVIPPWTNPPEWGKGEFILQRGECQTLNYQYRINDCLCCGDGYNEINSTDCKFCVEPELDDEGKLVFTSTCGGPTGPIHEISTCDLFTSNPVDSCNRVGIEGPDGDTLCCDPINMTLRGVDKFQNTDYCKCGFCEEYLCGDGEFWDEWGCMDCHEKESCKPAHCQGDPPWLLDCEKCSCKVVKDTEHCEECGDPIHPTSRQVGVGLSHPYLKEIWEELSKFETNGVFNFLRPEEIPPFQDIDAKDEIGYGYNDTSDLPPHCPELPDGAGNVSPGGGDFFYPHLGGVQLAKEWLTGMLMPQKSSLLELIF